MYEQRTPYEGRTLNDGQGIRLSKEARVCEGTTRRRIRCGLSKTRVVEEAVRLADREAPTA